MKFITLMAYLDYMYIYVGILVLFLMASVSKQQLTLQSANVSHKIIINLFAVSLVCVLLGIKMHLTLNNQVQIANFIAIFVAILLLAYFYAKRTSLDIETYTILLLIYWSFMVLIDSADLIVLYASLEVQTFCYCILITWQKKRTLFGAEGSLKYFLFGNLASILFLIGGLYIYYTLNLTDLGVLADAVYQVSPNAYRVSAFFFALAFMFKLGAVPFQFWLPDAYEAASLDVLFLLAFFLKYSFIIYFTVFNIYLAVMDISL